MGSDRRQSPQRQSPQRQSPQRQSRILLGALLACALLVTSAPADAADKPGKTYKNDVWGFKVRYPNKWITVNMSSKEQWIAAKFLGRRELYGAKGEGWGETPEMWVIAFPHARKRQRGAKREKVTESLTLITIENPYKNYKDFVKREKRLTTEGGYYYSREDESEIGGLPVSIYEIKVEKMVDVPRRIVTYVYHCDDVDFAIQFSLPEHHYKDWKGTIHTCMKSFRQIERTKPFPTATTTGKNIVDTEKEEALTPEERKKRRKQAVDKFIKDEMDNLPKGWLHMSTKNFCAFSGGDKKFTKRILDHAQNVYNYLEKTFPGLGSDYVPKGLIRVFKTRAEETAFQEGTSSLWFGDDEQILITQDTGGMLWEFSWLSSKVTRQWLYYKNRSLWNSMSPFLRWGLQDHMENMRPSKRKKLQYARDVGDILSMRKLINEGSARPIKDVLLKEKKPNEQGWTIGTGQTGSVMSWMLSDGNRGKLKGAITRYLTAMVRAIEVEDQKWEEEEAKKRKAWKEKVEKGEADDSDEPDPEDAWKDYQQRLQDKEDAIRQLSFDAAFGQITDKEWEKLDKKWRKYAIGK